MEKIKLCQCGCGAELPQRSGRGRTRRFLDGHNVKPKRAHPTICQCGCGQKLPNKTGAGRMRKFIDGHNFREKEIVSLKCACGCGGEVISGSGLGRKRKFLPGHNAYKRVGRKPRPAKEPKPKKRGAIITTICQCGCNREFSYTYIGGPKTEYIKAHRPCKKRELAKLKEKRKPVAIKPTQLIIGFCGCGCGQIVTQRSPNQKRIFVVGHSNKGVLKSDAIREKISAALKEKYKDKAYKNRVAEAVARALPTAHASHSVEFNGITYRSTWEAVRAAQLTEAGIRFEYETHELPYIAQDGTTRRYIPDFWLPDTGEFEEVKGYFREKDKDKMSRVLHAWPHTKLRVLEVTQEWDRIRRGEKPDVNRVKEITGWQKFFSVF